MAEDKAKQAGRSPATLPSPAMATDRVRDKSTGRLRYAGCPLYHHTNSRAENTPGSSCKAVGAAGRQPTALNSAGSWGHMPVHSKQSSHASNAALGTLGGACMSSSSAPRRGSPACGRSRLHTTAPPASACATSPQSACGTCHQRAMFIPRCCMCAAQCGPVGMHRRHGHGQSKLAGQIAYPAQPQT